MFGSLTKAQTINQIEWVADSRKPLSSEWSYRNNERIKHRNTPSFFTLQWGRLKRKNSWNHGFHLEAGYYQYTYHYAFSRYIQSGYIHYNIDRQIYGFVGGIGYTIEKRLNSPKGEAHPLTGTYLISEAAYSIGTMRGAAYSDSVGEKPLVEMQEVAMPCMFIHFFLGLSHNFKLKEYGHIRIKGGVDYVLSTDNGFYTQANYRFGIGYIPKGKIKD